MKMRRVAALAMVVAVVCFAACALADTKGAPARVQVKKTEPRTVAAMKHKGPFTDLQSVITKLQHDIQAGGYLAAGPVMCLFYNSPENTAAKDLEWQVLIPVVNPGQFGKAEYDQMGFQFSDVANVAYVYHVGPYEKINESYQVLFDWAKRNGYKVQGYPVEVYWSDPTVIPKEKLVTEVWMPVEERRVPQAVK